MWNQDLNLWPLKKINSVTNTSLTWTDFGVFSVLFTFSYNELGAWYQNICSFQILHCRTMTTSYGPSDPSLWLTRPLGHWERQLVVDWPAGVPGPSRCTINNVTLIKTNQDIDVDKWEAGVRNVVFREPNLRTDVDLKSDPVSWTPATDFSQVFSFRDVRDQGRSSLDDVWSIVEEEANRPWEYGSGKPLFRWGWGRKVR